MSATQAPINFKTEAEVLEYYKKDKDNNQVVIFEGVVYDVKNYMPEHPGGGDLIEKLLGMNIDEDFEEAEHTKTAKKLFKDLTVIGKMSSESDEISQENPKVPEYSKSSGQTKEESQGVQGLDIKLDKDLGEKLNFDYSKGIIYQVYNTNWTIKTYTDYINEPKHLVNPVRDLKMFDSAFLEAGSKTPWFVIPIAYAPFELFCIYNSIGTIQNSIMWFTIGMLFWTFAEYILHRFVFHGEEYWMPYILQNNFMYAFHFNIHGIHHAFPMDQYRLVFPPTIGYIVLYFMFYLPITKNFAPETAFPLLFGIMVGYQCYDLMHYFFHHSSPKQGSIMQIMKTYHMQHHYKYGTIGFGVSNKFWDVVFDTQIMPGGNKANQVAASENAKYTK